MKAMVSMGASEALQRQLSNGARMPRLCLRKLSN